MTFNDPPDETSNTHGPESLTIQFIENEEDEEDKNEGEQAFPVTNGMNRFLKKIGSSLKYLMLDGPRTDIDENMILRNCPQLERLSLCGGLVDVELCLKKYRALRRPTSVPELVCHWHDVASFSADLSDLANPLSKCVRQLRVRLKDKCDGWSIIEGSYGPPGFESNTNFLLEMLDKNKHLEYLEVIAPIEHEDVAETYTQYHLKPIKTSEESLLTSIAFLSIISWYEVNTQQKKKGKTTQSQPRRAICDLDRHLLTNIFEFAADRVFRQVYFHSQDDWDSEADHWSMRFG